MVTELSSLIVEKVEELITQLTIEDRYNGYETSFERG